MSSEDAACKINEYAVHATPFLLVSDFEGRYSAVLTLPEAEKLGVRFRMQEMGIGDWGLGIGDRGLGIRGQGLGIMARPFDFETFPVDFKTYRQAFEKVSWHLKRGDTYLINLTFPTEIRTDLGLQEIFERSTAPFKLLFGNHFVVFSPEPFISIKGGYVSSFPMKGTIDADLPDAEARLLGDEKEYFEHNTIVDLIRNDISMIATEVNVERFRYIEKISTSRKNLLQMSSEIRGRMPAGYLSHLGNDIFSLLPAGSVSGAPKEKTIQIIRETEPEARGFYTGIFGYFDGRDFSSAVMIRFIEHADGRLRYRSGGGITALSDCESEYRELIDKVYVPLV